MKRSMLPVRSPQNREKRQQNQESSQPDQGDKSTKSVQETVINKTVSNQGSKGVNIIQGKTYRIQNTVLKTAGGMQSSKNRKYINIFYYYI